jgi:hypothetical protein
MFEEILKYDLAFLSQRDFAISLDVVSMDSASSVDNAK